MSLLENQHESQIILILNSMKRNGFSCPTNIYQVITWLLFTIRSSHIFLILNSLIQRNYENCWGVLAAFIALIVFCFITIFIPTYIEPSDPFLIKELAKKSKCEKHKIAYLLEINITQDFCLICCSNIKSTSKHCKSCDRCVDNFDHHCIWLNNCVGQANYRYFILLIVTLLIESVYTIVTTLTFVIKILNNKEVLSQHQDNETFCIISLTFLAIDLLVLVNVLYLITVHIYLNCKGLTTYEYILLKSKKLERESRPNIAEEEKPAECNLEKESYIEMLKGMGKGKNKILPLELLNKLESNKYMEENDLIVIKNDAPALFKPITNKIYSQNKRNTIESSSSKDYDSQKFGNDRESKL